MNHEHEFSIGETVRIIAGPFQDFTARIVAIDTQEESLRVSVNIFGRTEHVVLSFLEVEKID